MMNHLSIQILEDKEIKSQVYHPSTQINVYNRHHLFCLRDAHMIYSAPNNSFVVYLDETGEV